jgi:hypothetical protein
MTRGLRNLQMFSDALAQARYADICAWPSTDYFCGVFPSALLLERLAATPDTLVKILYACSGRMQFNSWHYMPGHCPRDAVPADRHFYAPPRMPDIAVWSDQHHPGHVHAGVRHSIRSPAPITLDGVGYPGMIDLRLFRQRGPEYTERELGITLAYTEVLRAFSQAMADYTARTGTALCIGAFGKEWFQSYYTAQCAAHVRMPAAAAPQPTFALAHETGQMPLPALRKVSDEFKNRAKP